MRKREAPMKIDQPVDMRRLVASKSSISGDWPLARLERLRDLLEDTKGEVEYRLQFDTDEWGNAFVDVTTRAALNLLCQRSLHVYAEVVDRSQRLGLIETEADEAALPEGYEPHLLSDQPIRLIDLVEDELILSLPLVPAAPESETMHQTGQDASKAETTERQSPFAMLASLKTNKH